MWLAYRLACDPEVRLATMDELHTTLTLDDVDLLNRGYDAIARARAAAAKAGK